MPLVALLCLLHLGVARFVGILGRTGRGDDGGIHDGAARELQPILLQQFPHDGEQGGTEIMLLQQMPEVEQAGGVRHALAPQVHLAEVPEGFHIVQRILAGFIR